MPRRKKILDEEEEELEDTPNKRVYGIVRNIALYGESARIKLKDLNLEILKGVDALIYELDNIYYVIGDEKESSFLINNITIIMLENGFWEIRHKNALQTTNNPFILILYRKKFHFKKRGLPLKNKVLIH
jgi:hypothetical protein